MKVIKYKKTHVEKKEGELARIKVTQGVDVGSVYLIFSFPVQFGRAEENDIVLYDLKASRKHAILKKEKGEWFLEDLGSANKIIIGNQSVSKTHLKSGSVFRIGNTLFEFYLSTESTQVLMRPSEGKEHKKSEKATLEDTRIQKITHTEGLSGIFHRKSAAASMGDRSQKRKKILYALLAIAGILSLFNQGTEQVGKKLAKKQEKIYVVRDLSIYLPKLKGKKVSKNYKTANRFFKFGFREFREGNFLRAKKNFETALQIDPTHRLSSIYLENTKNSIHEMVKLHLGKGIQEMEAGRWMMAKNHFLAVMRLLYWEQENPAFSEAKEKLKELKEKSKEEY